MPKVTIYVPDGLAGRVRALGLSVSPICQAALSEEVERMQAIEAATRDIKRVSRRLKSTAGANEIEARKQGFADGTQWAREEATLGALRRVAGARLDYGRLQLPLEPVVSEYIKDIWDARIENEARWA